MFQENSTGVSNPEDKYLDLMTDPSIRLDVSFIDGQGYSANRDLYRGDAKVDGCIISSVDPEKIKKVLAEYSDKYGDKSDMYEIVCFAEWNDTEVFVMKKNLEDDHE